jgi:hypothetical protein
MKQMLKYMTARAAERSTWLGLTSVATALGLLLSSEQTEAVISAGMAVAGLIAAFSQDKRK